MESIAFKVGMVAGALFVGLLTGLVPLIAGLRKNKLGLAAGGFIACIVSGLLLGLILALPCCGIFTFLICRNKEEKPDDME